VAVPQRAVDVFSMADGNYEHQQTIVMDLEIPAPDRDQLWLASVRETNASGSLSNRSLHFSEQK
jgi:hypothetical protein